MSMAGSLRLADRSLREDSPVIGIKRVIPYASPRDPATDSAVGSTLELRIHALPDLTFLQPFRAY